MDGTVDGAPSRAMVGPPGGLIGPNAVTQVAASLRARSGEARTRMVFCCAGLREALDHPPETMTDEGAVARLHHRVAQEADGEALLADAGRRTADYILAHRIPRPAQWLLRALPPGPAARLLLSAIGRNAWTFAGSGRFRACPGRPAVVEIAANPIATPGCPWHRAVFAGLFEALVSSRAVVDPPACRGCAGCGSAAAVCRFEIRT